MAKLSHKRFLFPLRTHSYGIRNEIPPSSVAEGEAVERYFHIFLSRNQCVFQNFWEEKRAERALHNAGGVRETLQTSVVRGSFIFSVLQ